MDKSAGIVRVVVFMGLLVRRVAASRKDSLARGCRNAWRDSITFLIVSAAWRGRGGALR
jgi:hypothetical protein